MYRHKLVQVIRKCVQFCTDRQTVDSNVTRRMVIVYWIIKCTDTNLQNVLFNPFFSQNNYSDVPQFYVTSTLLYFLAFSLLTVRGGAVCVLLRHFNRCLTFVIMWCFEEYCDMHH